MLKSFIFQKGWVTPATKKKREAESANATLQVRRCCRAAGGACGCRLRRASRAPTFHQGAMSLAACKGTNDALGPNLGKQSRNGAAHRCGPNAMPADAPPSAPLPAPPPGHRRGWVAQGQPAVQKERGVLGCGGDCVDADERAGWGGAQAGGGVAGARHRAGRPSGSRRQSPCGRQAAAAGGIQGVPFLRRPPGLPLPQRPPACLWPNLACPFVSPHTHRCFNLRRAACCGVTCRGGW